MKERPSFVKPKKSLVEIREMYRWTLFILVLGLISVLAMLALDISQALYTTAAGLSVAIPAVAFFYFFRNRATNIILGMEALTMDLIKVLRNVEVVED